MSKLDEIKALADRIDGPLPSRAEDTTGRMSFCLIMSPTERNMLADALTVLYGVEHRSFSSQDGCNG